MDVREKTINGYIYLYLVESVREGSPTKQRIIKNLGRKEIRLRASQLSVLLEGLDWRLVKPRHVMRPLVAC